ncbi:ATP-binding protein [Saccharibacillus sp. CPCC 101409]|uniref:sensor histidine kinase n=1 Tax=Saccharibacillus sp. CPCC 101409 TaxID=3058041 RepID=UPI002673A4A5|nr:ATP-binding protein [Saccharibacillus sp. CPCC 101409]MDO3410464.1 ATP-binding protein [Saccharibacillus sp. CPCC 101409]
MSNIEILNQKIEELNQKLRDCDTELERLNFLLEQERTAREAAEEDSKNKSNFVAVLSHEIRNPINGIIGMSELLHGTEMNEEQRSYLDIIRTSNETLLELVNGILDMSRLEAGKMNVQHNPFDLVNTIEDLVYTLAPQAFQKKVEVVLDVESEIPLFVIGDALKVRQIFMNLMQNAIKFTHEGEVVFELKRIPSLDEKQVAVSCSVRDTGIGMSEEKLDRIFDVYTQVHEASGHHYGGAGLGLTITKNLVDLLGGRIEVTSRRGEGTTIEIILSFERYTDLPSIPFEEDVLDGMNFLVVDGQGTCRDVIVNMLKGWGATAESMDKLNDETVKRIGESSFDVVFIDHDTRKNDDAFRALQDIQDLNLFLLAPLGEKIDDEERNLFQSIVTKPIRKLHMLNAILALDKNNKAESE